MVDLNKTKRFKISFVTGSVSGSGSRSNGNWKCEGMVFVVYFIGL